MRQGLETTLTFYHNTRINTGPKEDISVFCRGRSRRLIVLWLCIALFSLQIASHVNGFDVPESDFFRITGNKRLSCAICHGLSNLNAAFIPIGMAMVSLVFQGPARELTAARVDHRGQRGFILVAGYRIARHYLGDKRFWAPGFGLFIRYPSHGHQAQTRIFWSLC